MTISPMPGASFTIPASVLHEAAEFASRATPARSPVPMLLGLLLTVSDEGLTLSGFDLERCATVTVDAVVRKPGRLLVPGRLLTDVAKVAGKADLQVEMSGGGPVTIQAPGARWSLPSLPLDEYPQLPEQGEPVGSVNAGDLRMAVRRIIAAAGRDSTLPMLTGIHLEGNPKSLTLTATDRWRMATTVIPWTPTVDTFEMLVPAELLNVAVKAPAGDHEELSLTTAGGHMFGVASPTCSITGRILDVEFVQWRRVIDSAAPSGRNTSVVTADMLRAIAQVSTTSTDRTDQLTLDVTESQVQVTVTGDDRSSAVEVAADTEGDDIRIGFNARYLRDALDSVASERVTLHFGASNTRPALAMGDDPDAYRHLVMPVRIPDAA